jgi:PncC family amidohydrolase
MSLQRKLKNALDETRLLILGAQVLFGFQFNGMFQEAFADLDLSLRLTACAGLVLIMIAIGLLIAPSMQHRIVERGEDSDRILSATTTLAALALFPLAMALGLDVFMAIERTFGLGAGMGLGASFFILAITFWYVLEFAIRENKPMRERHDGTGTPLSSKVEQMLTEARVIIPGAQALLGFQLTVTLTRAFEQIPFESKLAHAAALCCIALSVILLMAPAALHRISFGGEDSADFLKIGSVFIVAAPLPLALGIALDTYVAIARALESNLAAASIAGTTVIVLTLLWYAYPVWRRINPGTSQSPPSEAFNSMQQSLTGDLALAAVRVLDVAKKRNLTIVTAESCTAGMLSTILSEAPGASEHLHGGFVTYTKENKTKILGVSEHLLTEKSAVCPDVAMAMAEGALKRSPADLAVAVTGVAGPEPDEDGNPVGRTCIAVARRGHETFHLERNYGDIGRDAVRRRAVADALSELISIADKN